MNPADTIAAIATARGRAALAIVRMSGPDALSISDRLFLARSLAEVPSHTAHVGFLTALGGARLDQVVVTVFRGPHSATGEDVVEISCHGGDLASQQILRALVDAGARLARPGEFTERAFLHGKLDLAQAEAVADLIHAQSSLAHRVSLNHLQGRYSEAIDAIRDELLQTCALIELELDFSEEDVEFADRAQLEGLLERTETLLAQLLGSYRLGTLVRDGVRVVIGGRPNAGKSTLLNALVGEDRAIVSPTPGTTRDEIMAEAEIGGLTFQFIDTAGLRETADAIEAEGVRRTHRAIGRSDVLVYVYDVTQGLDAEEEAWLERFEPDLGTLASDRVTVKHSDELNPVLPLLLVANKADLLLTDRGGSPPARRALTLSAHRALRDPQHLAALRQWLLDAVAEGLTDVEATPIVVNQRHRAHLDAALGQVRASRKALAEGLTGDMLALDLRGALYELGAITGAVTNEDILGAIFSTFCIGK